MSEGRLEEGGFEEGGLDVCNNTVNTVNAAGCPRECHRVYSRDCAREDV